MTLLKVDKYLELTDGRRPVTLCKKGDVQPYVVLTKGSEAALTASGTYMDLPVTISNAGVGVGQASNIVEELIQLGGKVFILLGATGAIQEDINLGDIVVPTGSVRDEGLSDYYAPKQYPAVADYRIVSALVRAAAEEGYRSHAGIIRTTEGPNLSRPGSPERRAGSLRTADHVQHEGLLCWGMLDGPRQSGPGPARVAR